MGAVLCRTLVALCIAGAAGPALADVWGYVDAKGVAHFATEKLDDRYEIYFLGGASFDTKEGVLRADSMPRPVSVPKNAPKLLAFFDISPNFKAVKHHLREAASVNKIDFELLQALIATESGFDAAAVSPKGAVGLMQLMPPTAQRYGVVADAKTPIEKKLTDPKINIKAGSRYLRDLLTMFSGNLELALAAYNAGEGAVKRHGNKIPPFPETQNYVKTVMQIYTFLKPPSLQAANANARATDGKTPSRVRMDLGIGTGAAGGNGPVGGAAGRGNMVPPLAGSNPSMAGNPRGASSAVGASSAATATSAVPTAPASTSSAAGASSGAGAGADTAAK